MLWVASALGADSEVLFTSSVAAERAGDFVAAIAACEAIIAADPHGARAPSCERRLDRWKIREDVGGGFRSLITLMQVRETTRDRGPEAGRDALGDLLETGGLSPTMEVEVRIWLARDALDVLGDPSRAEAVAERGLRHRDDVEQALVTQLLSLRSRALVATGDLDEALETEAEIRVGSTRESPVQLAIRERRRARISVIAAGTYGAFMAFGMPIAVIGWRRERPVPWGLVPIAVGSLGGAAIAYLWAPGAGYAALAGGGLYSIVHLVAVGIHAWLRTAPDRSWLRPVARLAATVATLAGLWLAVSVTGTFHWMGW